MRWLMVLLLFIVFPSSAREPGTTRLAERWARADIDRDGQLDRREAARIKAIRDRFDAIDTNGDGRVSVEELRAARTQSKRRRAPRPVSAALIARADRNGDAAMDRAEAQASFPRIADRFDALDADRDGRIDPGELDRWLAERRAARARR